MRQVFEFYRLRSYCRANIPESSGCSEIETERVGQNGAIVGAIIEQDGVFDFRIMVDLKGGRVSKRLHGSIKKLFSFVFNQLSGLFDKEGRACPNVSSSSLGLLQRITLNHRDDWREEERNGRL